MTKDNNTSQNNKVNQNNDYPKNFIKIIINIIIIMKVIPSIMHRIIL